MKPFLSLPLLGFLLSTSGLDAADSRAKSSLLNSDPDVVYAEEFTEKEIEFLVVKPATVFATKKGGRKLGVLKADSKVTFIGMTEKAYKVRGTATHGKVLGWVSPRFLGSKDKDFVENLKKVYERQKVIRELVAKHEVAIGMSIEEVSASLGKPTKTKVRQTVKGRTGVWEFGEHIEEHCVAIRLLHDFSDFSVQVTNQSPCWMIDNLIKALKSDTALSNVTVKQSDSNDDI